MLSFLSEVCKDFTVWSSHQFNPCTPDHIVEADRIFPNTSMRDIWICNYLEKNWNTKFNYISKYELSIYRYMTIMITMSQHLSALWLLLIGQHDEEEKEQAAGKHSASTACIQKFCLLQIPEHLKKANDLMGAGRQNWCCFWTLVLDKVGKVSFKFHLSDIHIIPRSKWASIQKY